MDFGLVELLASEYGPLVGFLAVMVFTMLGVIVWMVKRSAKEKDGQIAANKATADAILNTTFAVQTLEKQEEHNTQILAREIASIKELLLLIVGSGK